MGVGGKHWLTARRVVTLGFNADLGSRAGWVAGGCRGMFRRLAVHFLVYM